MNPLGIQPAAPGVRDPQPATVSPAGRVALVDTRDEAGHGGPGDSASGDAGGSGSPGGPGRAQARRLIPRTDVLLADPRLASAEQRLGRALVKQAVSRAQEAARAGRIGPDSVADAAVDGLPPRSTTLTPVINATGVLLHTNLGRAPLSAAARDALQAAAGCTDVEFDLPAGERGRRGRGTLTALAAAVPAAQAVAVLNNNAAALVLAATALAAGRQIVVSRGELIEIGDGFRLPELLESTGARLREVGTTNRTSVADYRAAIGPQTAFLLKVHTSNYRIEGFTAEASIAELAGLGVPVVADIGSGLLAPSAILPGEPDADSALRAGAALVTASGDKLLGGPQAGLLLGQGDLVRTLTRHPLARALRVDKLTLAALEATLAGPRPPAQQALAADPTTVMERAQRIAARLAAVGVDARAIPCQAAVGGGGAPGVLLPSAAISLPPGLAGVLRSGEAVRRGDTPAVAGRVASGRLLLDLRAVPAEDDELICAAVIAAAGV
jgi:L-seryl-tRNA(Ser) seleniumtransferase